LAIAAGIWLVEAPDSKLQNSGRNILSREIRLEPQQKPDRTQFLEKRPMKVEATGAIAGRESITCFVRFERKVHAQPTRMRKNA